MTTVRRDHPPAKLQLEQEQSEFAARILDRLIYACGKTAAAALDYDWYCATALAVRDRIVDRWQASSARADEKHRKHVYYLSVEFLIGRLLFDSLVNLQMVETARGALASLGTDLDRLRALEPDAALGNGGLGRLAACYMDSMSALAIPAYGYGIRYEHGLFEQQFADGWQQELPDNWLYFNNRWEFRRPEIEYSIRFGGRVEYGGERSETAAAIWSPTERILAVAYDTPLVGWRGHHVNALRLWSARATNPIHLKSFNQGDYVGAMANRAEVEAISRVLYPSDETPSGQELRLRQEYFFTSASLQDIVTRHTQAVGDLNSLPDHAAIQLNDTHPAIAVPELMRILVDENGIPWERAWSITCATFSYTNHTLLPEAIETWPVSLLGRLLPRHLQIIYTINWLHLKKAREAGIEDFGKLAALSIIAEHGEKRVRMGHLAFIGSHKVNGVSALHTELLRKTVFHDLEERYPRRIVNKTNGITFRRWLYEANPGLTALLSKTAGKRVLDDPDQLRAVEHHAADENFVARYAAVRLANKQALARRLRTLTGVTVDTAAIFDVQIKRIHEYKRQLLNLLEIVALFDDIRAQPHLDWVPRVKIFAGKAAPSYQRAKLIIKLINDVARAVNGDPIIGNRLKVLFVPNYSVSLAEEIVAAADISEQISTAGMEASGTGNMKLALNGALTVGTLDGANVEIRDRVGAENLFIFGLTTSEVEERRRSGFTGRDAAGHSPMLSDVLHSIADGRFSPDEVGRFRPLVDSVLGHDPFMVAADFDAYWRTQREADALWRQPQEWWRRSILNTARMGWFSSDRAVREYAEDIWNIPVR